MSPMPDINCALKNKIGEPGNNATLNVWQQKFTTKLSVQLWLSTEHNTSSSIIN
jgi:hypothetical protein